MLARDADHAPALLTLARSELHLGRPDEAIGHALDAIGLQFGNPLGHLVVGQALLAQGHAADAASAFSKAIALEPGFVEGYRSLAEARRQSGRLAETEAADADAVRVAEAESQRTAERHKRVRREARVRAEARAEADRLRAAETPAATAVDSGAASSPGEAEAPEKEFIVVSGLPRSGTSLMMQILRAGGIAPMTDAQRAADEDNPEGYWEWEEIKNLPKDPSIIERAEGKAVKVISALLPALLMRHRYTIIYMVRPVEQVVDSQAVMLARRGRSARTERRN